MRVSMIRNGYGSRACPTGTPYRPPSRRGVTLCIGTVMRSPSILIIAARKRPSGNGSIRPGSQKTPAFPSYQIASPG